MFFFSFPFFVVVALIRSFYVVASFLPVIFVRLGLEPFWLMPLLLLLSFFIFCVRFFGSSFFVFRRSIKVVNDDYAFYETGALASAAVSGNSWAGASHWKFVGIKKKVLEMRVFTYFCLGRGGGAAHCHAWP